MTSMELSRYFLDYAKLYWKLQKVRGDEDEKQNNIIFV